MGPHADQERWPVSDCEPSPIAVNETMRALDLYRHLHPQVIITAPENTGSKLWEVSLPSRAAMAFEDPGEMLTTLCLMTIPDIDT